MIQITYYGHSCFQTEADGHSVIFDPYADQSVPGLKLPLGLTADRVYCSHEHADHNARDLIKETSPSSDPFHAEFLTVPHDDANGTKRGMSKITILNIHGKRIVHFGDIGRLPTEKEYEHIGKADLILIPVGGYFTIDANQAKQIIDELKPVVTILMHYRKGNRGYDVIADIEDIRKVFPDLIMLPQSQFILEEKTEEQIITLEPVQ